MKSILFSAVLLLSWAVGAQAPATAPVALKDEPHHHSLFENEYARAWAFGITGHQATLLHNHDLPYFGVAVGSAGRERAESARDAEAVKVQELAARIDPEKAEAALDSAHRRLEGS